METIEEIIIQKISHSSLHLVDWDHLEFGKYNSDHMLVCDYAEGEWKVPEIVPFSNLSLSPTALALHYGQTIFEGMKAFRMQDGSINIFRPRKHYERMLLSAERMCMPAIPRQIFLEGLQRLVELDSNWVPSSQGSALYIRPFMIATEARLGVKVAEEYKFIIVNSPVETLYPKPIKVKIERDFVRACRGGTGYAKCGGNYGAAFYPTQKARQEGFDQVIWMDSRENNYVEESGMMNVMFVIGDKIMTPPLSDSILDGVTRDSLLVLARDAGIPVEEKPIHVDQLKDAFRKNSISEAFGVGTAAVASAIQMIGIDDLKYYLPSGPFKVMEFLKNKFNRVRTGLDPDIHRWNHVV
ncbi:MAG: branched chain amino acid aminotransferase [Bacteroidetes bacterium]|nr:MAG: branched chain amino acid aminotransferase [Bacteroidota bacterium]